MKGNNKEMKRKKKMWIIAALIICILIAVIIVFPPSMGRTKPFVDEYGNVLEGSISEKIWVDINGTKLGMFVMAKDETKPVLLFLGGGPGLPEYLLESLFPTKLADEFVVCYPEYRGTSLSYRSNMAEEEMTMDTYLEDIEGITNYLRERFAQDKIYLMSHSFGTSIGLQIAAAHPEYYYAYIAMSQVTDQRLSEEMAYDYMYEQYKQAGNKKRLEQFDACPIKDSEEAYERYFTSNLRDFAMHELGVGTTRTMDSVITGIFFPSFQCRVYTPIERINIWIGKNFAQQTPIAKDAIRFNAFEQVPSLELPIYFLAGKYDYTCCYSLQKEYYEQVQAPVKEFYTFDQSAHSPLFEENEKAMEILQKIVEANH